MKNLKSEIQANAIAKTLRLKQAWHSRESNIQCRWSKGSEGLSFKIQSGTLKFHYIFLFFIVFRREYYYLHFTDVKSNAQKVT